MPKHTPPDPSRGGELTLSASSSQAITRRKHPVIYQLFGALAELLAILPAMGSSKRQRAHAKQLKGSLIAVGIITVLGGHESWPIILIGFLLMASAVVLPLPAMWKRDKLKSLKERRFFQEEVRRPARLVHDGRRLILEAHEQPARRVLTDRSFTLETRRDPQGSTWVGVIPRESKKKRDAIWLHLPHLPADPSLPEVEPWRIDTPLHVDDQEHERSLELLDRLRRAHERAA